MFNVNVKKKDVQKVFENKKVLHSNNFIVYFLLNDISYPRFAFVASKKHIKKSVERNRAKRLLKEAVRLHLNIIKNLNCDIIFVAKKEILGKKLYDISDEVKNVLLMLREKC